MTGKRDRTWADVIRAAITAELAELHTGLPAKVVSFDASKQSVDAQPLLKRVYLDPDTDEPGDPIGLPTITNVPISYPAGGGWSITWDLASDDIVYLAPVERSLDRWKEATAGESVDPIDSRRFGLSDVIAIPGIRPRTSPLAGVARSGLRLGKDDGSTEISIDGQTGKVVIKSTMIELGDSPTEQAMLGNAVLQFLINFVTVFNSHVHPTAGPGAPSPPQLVVPVPPDIVIPFLPPLPDLLSTVVKVK